MDPPPPHLCRRYELIGRLGDHLGQRQLGSGLSGSSVREREALEGLRAVSIRVVVVH